jgi:hypothetical protein
MEGEAVIGSPPLLLQRHQELEIATGILDLHEPTSLAAVI